VPQEVAINNMETINVKIAENQTEISSAKEIRRMVFQIEQGIDSNLDFDNKDEEAEHIIAYFGKEAVGTVRIRYILKKTAKLERVAVLKAYRKTGIGTKMIDYIIDYLQKKGMEEIMLDAQEQAKKFYEGIGFKKKGQIFEESGIPHIEMWKRI
jgi:predicted GNAT family N-acyltransferase